MKFYPVTISFHLGEDRQDDFEERLAEFAFDLRLESYDWEFGEPVEGEYS